MSFFSLSCFPAVEDNSYIMMLFLFVINQGCYEILSLFFKVSVGDPDKIIAVYDDVGNMIPPDGGRKFPVQICLT